MQDFNGQIFADCSGALLGKVLNSALRVHRKNVIELSEYFLDVGKVCVNKTEISNASSLPLHVPKESQAA